MTKQLASRREVTRTFESIIVNTTRKKIPTTVPRNSDQTNSTVHTTTVDSALRVNASQVIHAFLELAFDATVPKFLGLLEHVFLIDGTTGRRGIGIGEPHKKLVEVAAPALAG